MNEIFGVLGTILAPVAIIGAFVYVVVRTKDRSIKDEYGDRNNSSGFNEND